MPFPLIPLAISLLGSLGGGLANKKKTATSTQDNKTSSFNDFFTKNVGAQSQTPTYDPETANFMNLIRGKYTDMINEDPDLKGYQANELSNINRSSNLLQDNLSNNLASRGINGPAAELAKLGIGNNAFSEKTKLSNSIPLLSQQLRGDILGKAGSFFSTIPHGNYDETFSSSNGYNRTDGTSNSTGTQTEPGNALGGGIGNLSQLLAYFYGKGAFGGTK